MSERQCEQRTEPSSGQRGGTAAGAADQILEDITCSIYTKFSTSTVFSTTKLDLTIKIGKYYTSRHKLQWQFVEITVSPRNFPEWFPSLKLSRYKLIKKVLKTDSEKNPISVEWDEKEVIFEDLLKRRKYLAKTRKKKNFLFSLASPCQN